MLPCWKAVGNTFWRLPGNALEELLDLPHRWPVLLPFYRAGRVFLFHKQLKAKLLGATRTYILASIHRD